jgi:small subunit ribosomal protein S4
MGDPKKPKKKYETPRHPWNKASIDIDREIRKEFGLRNRKELLIAESFLKKYKDIAKRLIADTTVQGEKEEGQIIGKMQRLGLLSAGAKLDNILSLELKDVLERRLQSIIFRRGLARSMRQARQFITHRHVRVGAKEITAPGFIVSLEEESALTFRESSNLADAEHPERVNLEKEIKQEAAAIKGDSSDPLDTAPKVKAGFTEESKAEAKEDSSTATKGDTTEKMKADVETEKPAEVAA